MTFLTLLLKWHFSPQAWNALNTAKFSNQRFTQGTRLRVGLYLLSENFKRTWREGGVLLGSLQPGLFPGSPKLYTNHCSYIPLFISKQEIIVVKRWTLSTGISQKFRISQPASVTCLGLLHRLHDANGLPPVPFKLGSLFSVDLSQTKQLLSLETHPGLLPEGGPNGRECWGHTSSNVLLQRFVVLFMWCLYCVWKNILVGLGFHMLDSPFFFKFSICFFGYGHLFDVIG